MYNILIQSQFSLFWKTSYESSTKILNNSPHIVPSVKSKPTNIVELALIIF